MLNGGGKAQLCWKCRYLVTKYGFLKRRNKYSPCDLCLGLITTFQCAVEESIWLKYIPNKPKRKEERKDERRKEVKQDRPT